MNFQHEIIYSYEYVDSHAFLYKIKIYMKTGMFYTLHEIIYSYEVEGIYKITNNFMEYQE